jgi:cell division transport system permease protein
MSLIFRRRFDLPLERDRSTRSLALIVAVMVYLASLALAVTLAIGGAVERWNSGLAGTMTVEVPPEGAARLGALVEALKRVPGVRSAVALDAAATEALVEPWLGPGVKLGDLPLPRLVDLRVDPRVLVPEVLGQVVASAAPGAFLDDHRRWVDRLVAASLAVRLAGLAVLALIAAAAIAVVVFATRAGLAAHHSVVEVLHLIGAQDRYIARQFERQALRLGFRGALIGIALGAVTVAGIAWAADASAALRLLPDLSPPPEWLLFLALPIVVAAVARLTARVTVMRALARMP